MSETFTGQKMTHEGRLYYLLDDGTCLSTYNGFDWRIDVWPEPHVGWKARAAARGQETP